MNHVHDCQAPRESFRSDDHRPEPDFVWCQKILNRRVRRTSEQIILLMEVADSSVVLDLHEKASLYAEHSIPECWVVDIPSQQLRVHQNPRDGKYQMIQRLTSPASISPVF